MISKKIFASLTCLSLLTSITTVVSVSAKPTQNQTNESFTEEINGETVEYKTVAPSNASDALTVSIKTERVEENDSDLGVYKGDIKATVRINQKKNIYGYGIVINIGNGLSYRLDSSSDPIAVNDKDNGIVAKCNGQQATFAAAGEEYTDELASFYITKNSNANAGNCTINLTNINLFNPNGGSFDFSNTTTYNTIVTSCILGDLNNDNKSDASDATLVLIALDNHNTSSASVYNVCNNLNSWFPQAKSGEQADVNNDKYVSKTDANDILHAYAARLNGSYKGNIGNSFTAVVNI